MSSYWFGDLLVSEPKCWCIMCHEGLPRTHMIVCPECGNKRCPRATSHANLCSGSNEPGQPGSAYEMLARR